MKVLISPTDFGAGAGIRQLCSKAMARRKELFVLDRDLLRSQAEARIAAAVRPEPDHAVTVDFEHVQQLPLVGPQTRLILRRQSVGARSDRDDSNLSAYPDGAPGLVHRRQWKSRR